MRCDSGSIIPLGIAVITLSAIFSLVTVELIGIQFQTLQNKQVADVLVLKVSSDLHRDAIPPVTGLDYSPTVSEELKQSSSHLGIEPVGIAISTVDGKTLSATVCTTWKSITGFKFGAWGNVCAQSNARAIS